MDNAVELKPCPFCGSPGVAVVGSFVRCGSCGSAGPYGSSEAEAVQRWNARLATERPPAGEIEPVNPGGTEGTQAD